jgi:alpha-tubulin suppressor-like RCC1 family protein
MNQTVARRLLLPAWRVNGTSFFSAYARAGAVASLGMLSVASSTHGQTLAGGRLHSLQVANGTVLTWGYNSSGQLGAEGGTRPLPLVLPELGGATAVAAGEFHSLVLKADGTVWSFGHPQSGALGPTDVVPTPPDYQPRRVTGVPSAIAVAAGSGFSLALAADGTVWSWGLNNEGQLGDGSTTTTGPTPRPVVGLGTIVAISAGSSHAMALAADGTAYAWGSNTTGKLGAADPYTPRSTPIQFGALTGVVGIAAGGGHSLAVLDDGTVFGASSSSSYLPVSPWIVAEVTGLPPTCGVAAGGSHSLFRACDGSVWSVGQGGDGQLGLGPIMSQATPMGISGLADVVAIEAGQSHSMATTGDGSLWAWGDNIHGQLGDGTFVDRRTPTSVSVAGAWRVGTPQFTWRRAPTRSPRRLSSPLRRRAPRSTTP